MDQFEHFINYEEDPGFKFERLGDLEIFHSPEIGNFDSPDSHQMNNQFHPNNFFNPCDEETDSYRSNDRSTSQKTAPFIINNNKREKSPESTIYGSSPNDDSDDGIAVKSKRISKKRDDAKKRTKAKSDLNSMISQVDSKYLPEGFDNPNLDDHTKKKMVQMIRNRVSAQASRDKKKNYLQQLEDARHKLAKDNQNLHKQNTALLQQLKSVEYTLNQIRHENEELKRTGVCVHCGHSQSQSSGYDQNQSSDELYSNPSSPTLVTRGGRQNRGFFGYAMAFATILSVVIMVLLGNTDSITGNFGNREKLPTMRYLAENSLVESHFGTQEHMIPNNIPFKVSIDEIPIESSISEKETYFMETVRVLRKEFQQHHQSVYNENEKKLILDPKENTTKPYSEKNKNAVVDYKFYQRKFLAKQSQIPPNMMIEDYSDEEVKTSTLFCPHSFEFRNVEEKEGDFESAGVLAPQVHKAQYIQLFIPKNSVHLSYLTDQYSEFEAPILQDNEEGSMLEVWCKVFYVRELSSF